MDPFSNKISCLLNLIIIYSSYKDDVNKNYSKEYDKYYTNLYQLLMALPRKDLIDFKSLEAERWIPILVAYFESKEEYEKCSKLHKLGYKILNTID